MEIILVILLFPLQDTCFSSGRGRDQDRIRKVPDLEDRFATSISRDTTCARWMSQQQTVKPSLQGVRIKARKGTVKAQAKHEPTGKSLEKLLSYSPG